MPRGQNQHDEVDLDDEDFDVDDENPIDNDDADDDDEDDAIRNSVDINRIVRQQLALQQADINNAMARLEARLQDHEHRLTNVEKMVTNLANTPSPKKKSLVPETEATGLDRFLDVTLGTAGRAMHAVVDTIAFVGESAVDIVTLGRARVNRN